MNDLDNKRHTQGTAGDEGTPPANYRTTPALMGRGNAASVHKEVTATYKRHSMTISAPNKC